MSFFGKTRRKRWKKKMKIPFLFYFFQCWPFLASILGLFSGNLVFCFVFVLVNYLRTREESIEGAVIHIWWTFVRVHDTLGAREKNRTFSRRNIIRPSNVAYHFNDGNDSISSFALATLCCARHTWSIWKGATQIFFCLKIESTPNSFAFFLLRVVFRIEKKKTKPTKFRFLYIFVNPTPDMYYSSNSSIETRMVIARTNPKTKMFL